jgi:hypothetical protein
MNFEDSSSVSTSWTALDSNPFVDAKSTCLPCASGPPSRAPCAACPEGATFAQRLVARDTGMPCCVTEAYGGSHGWPWLSASTVEPSGGLLDSSGPDLWRDLYEIKNRAAEGGFKYAPIFNPYVL